MPTNNIARCPVCNRRGQVAGQLFRCPQHGLFDDEPNEGGTHSDHNAAARLERAERRREHHPDTNYHPQDWNN